MNEQPTIVILSPGFPENEMDTNCMPFPQCCIKNLKQLHPSLNIIVIAFQYPFSEVVYKWHGIQVIPLNGRNRKRVKRLLVWKRATQKLKDIFLKYHVIGMLSLWLGECALIGEYAKKKYHVKHFIWLLGQDARPNNRYIRWIKPVASSLIALSDAVSGELYKNYRIRPAHTIPAGIDTTIFCDKPTHRIIDILGVGSLIPLKQYDIFITVIEVLLKEMPQLQAKICGDGDDREKLQYMISERNLTNNVQLLGDVTHNKVLTLMQSSRILLHPSAYEGFSTACNEALYAGAHVVTFCKPMNKNIDHLHIVSNTSQMIDQTRKLLLGDPDHDRVLTYPIAETCSKLLKFYT